MFLIYSDSVFPQEDSALESELVGDEGQGADRS